jgi:hypothetical protein
VVLVGALAAGCTDDDVAFPTPDELGADPLPEGAEVGGWDAEFASLVTREEGDTVCRAYLRFEPDGTVTYSQTACDQPGSELDWLDPAESEVDRGDYAVDGDLVTARVVIYDFVTESFSVRELRGERCLDRLVVQVPDATGYLGVPSPLTEPVLTYEQLSGPDLPDSEPGCNVASFEMVSRSVVALAGNRTTLEVRTDAGVACSLVFDGPDGYRWPGSGEATVVADDDGRCQWDLPVGPTPGPATSTVSVDEITQSFGIDIR